MICAPRAKQGKYPIFPLVLMTFSLDPFLKETLDLVGNCTEDSVAKTRPSRVRSHLLGRTR